MGYITVNDREYRWEASAYKDEISDVLSIEPQLTQAESKRLWAEASSNDRKDIDHKKWDELTREFLQGQELSDEDRDEVVIQIHDTYSFDEDIAYDY